MRTLIVSANLALMLSAVFAPFLGAIAIVFEWVSWAVVEGRLGRLAAEVEREQGIGRRCVCERESSIVWRVQARRLDRVTTLRQVATSGEIEWTDSKR